MRIIVLTALICLVSSCERQNKPFQPAATGEVRTRVFQAHSGRDTAAYAVLPYDAGLAKEISPQARATTLSCSELDELDGLLLRSVAEANLIQQQKFGSAARRKAYTIDLATHHYRRQVVAVLVPSGDKVAWVNCFCGNFENWRSQMIFVDDGGNCFFNVKINLTTGRWYGFAMNGQG